MKSAAGLVLAVSLIAAGCAPRGREAQQAEDQAAVEATVRGLYQAWAAEDEEALVRVVAADSSLTVFEHFPYDQGWEGFRQHFEPEWEEIAEWRFEPRITRVRVDQRMAWATGEMEIWGRREDGREFQGTGLATHVLEKRQEGWRITHIHWSFPRPRQP